MDAKTGFRFIEVDKCEELQVQYINYMYTTSVAIKLIKIFQSQRRRLDCGQCNSVTVNLIIQPLSILQNVAQAHATPGSSLCTLSALWQLGVILRLKHKQKGDTNISKVKFFQRRLLRGFILITKKKSKCLFFSFFFFFPHAYKIVASEDLPSE